MVEQYFLCIYSAVMCPLSKKKHYHLWSKYDIKMDLITPHFTLKSQTEFLIYHYNSIQFVFSAAICSRPTVQNTGSDVELILKLPLSTVLLHKKSEENTAFFTAWLSQYVRAGLLSWAWLKGFAGLEDSSC